MATNQEPYDQDFSVGTLVDGRYEIREMIGSGGMGAVYRARDMRTGWRVALKMLRASTGKRNARMEERRRRLLQEVALSGRVDHPNIVKVHDFGFFRDTPFIVMEFLDGRDLGRVIEDERAPLTVEYVADVMLVVCSALRACHAAKVIHRDLKPSNIMIVKSQSGLGWEVKLVDFSISKVLAEDDVTEDGRVLGTAHYLAPEQLENQAAPASDQYAIGVLLYAVLTNRLPYGDVSGHALHRAIFEGRFPPPCELRPDLPKKLGDVIVRAMRRWPDERFPSVYELGQALWEFGSELGRQNWKKYYFNQTPEVGSAKMSSVGVPLIAKILQGGSSLEKATALAHYDSTTSIGVVTVNDGVPKPTSDTVEDSKPMTGLDQAPSATSIDVTLRPSSVSPTGAGGDNHRSEQGVPVTRLDPPPSATSIDTTLPAPSSPSPPRGAADSDRSGSVAGIERAPAAPLVESLDGSPGRRDGAGTFRGPASHASVPHRATRLRSDNFNHVASAKRAIRPTLTIVLTLVGAAALGSVASWLILQKAAPPDGEQVGQRAAERAAPLALPEPVIPAPPAAAQAGSSTAAPSGLLPTAAKATAPAADTSSPDTPADPAAASGSVKPKHHRRSHRSRQEAGAAADWTLDPSGNPIPPL